MANEMVCDAVWMGCINNDQRPPLRNGAKEGQKTQLRERERKDAVEDRTIWELDVVVTAIIAIKVAFFRKVSFFLQTLCKSVPATVMVTESVCQEYVTVSPGSMAWTARKVRDTPITPRTLSYSKRESLRKKKHWQRERSENNFYLPVTHTSEMENDPLM